MIKKRNTNNLRNAATLSIVAAGLATYSHFFGYSFLKGRLKAAGFDGGIQIDMSVQESVHQATEGLLYMLSTALENGILKALLQLALYPAVLVFVGALAWMTLRRMQPRWNNVKTHIQTLSFVGKWRWTRAVALPLGAAAAFFVSAYAAFFAVFIGICLFWVLTAYGQLLGYTSMSSELRNERCYEIDWNKEKRDILIGCRRIIPPGRSEPLFGHVIYANHRYMYFLSEEGALRLPADTPLTVPFIYRPVDESGAPDNKKSSKQ